jgi:Protein of unknown function VcgC/VcgE (DUF2780)
MEVPMSRHGRLVLACGTLIVLGAAIGLARASQGASEAASAAAKASPELVNSLAKEINATPEQAAGAAGSLFGIAKSRLKPDEFSQVATAVPGMDSLLKAAPAVGGAAALSQLGGSASGLASAASAFSKLGLKPDLVAKAVPVLTSFVTKSGGAGVGSLLAGVLK